MSTIPSVIASHPSPWERFRKDLETARENMGHGAVMLDVTSNLDKLLESSGLIYAVLGEDAVPGTPEFNLFIKEVRKEMTVKCGQKCTAIRRIIVPEHLMEDVQIALGKQLSKVKIGNPTSKQKKLYFSSTETIPLHAIVLLK